MAEIHLLVDNPARLVDFGPDTAYLAGLDLAPWQGEWSETVNGWRLRFDEIDSPRLHLTMSDGGASGWMLCTATLRPRQRPYRLWLEIARGTVDRLRNRVAAWQVLSFEPSEQLQQQLSQCSLRFCEASAASGDGLKCDQLALEVIDEALQGMSDAVGEYVAFLRSGLGDGSGSATLRGTWLSGIPSVQTPATESESKEAPVVNGAIAEGLEQFVNTIAIAPDWPSIEPIANEFDWSSFDRLIEAANGRAWNVVLGPLISFSRAAWPSWLVDNTDPNEIRRGVQRFVGRVMERYSGQVDLAILADRVNLPDGLDWDGPLRLQYVIDAGTTLRRAVDNLPFVVAFTQPFAEGQPRGFDYPAFHLADALLRANLDVSGFALDFEFGGAASQTRPRDLCQLFERLQHWNSFGLPLVVTTSQYSAPLSPALGTAIDSTEGLTFDADHWGQPGFERWLEILDASRMVHAVFWNHAVDDPEQRRGLVDETGAPTSNGILFRQAFRLPGPNDTLPS